MNIAPEGEWKTYIELLKNNLKHIKGGVKGKLSRRLSQNQARPQIRFRDMDEAGAEDGDGEADTMFYITLTIEEDSGTGGPLTLVPGHDSDVDSNTYSQMSTDSGSSAHRHVTTPTRRTNRSNYSVVRPGVPPPAPPTRHPPVPGHHTDTDNSDVSEEASDSLSGDNSITSSTQDSSSQSHNDSLLLCDSLKVNKLFSFILPLLIIDIFRSSMLVWETVTVVWTPQRWRRPTPVVCFRQSLSISFMITTKTIVIRTIIIIMLRTLLNMRMCTRLWTI